jgi:hypothetical protein
MRYLTLLRRVIAGRAFIRRSQSLQQTRDRTFRMRSCCAPHLMGAHLIHPCSCRQTPPKWGRHARNTRHWHPRRLGPLVHSGGVDSRASSLRTVAISSASVKRKRYSLTSATRTVPTLSSSAATGWSDRASLPVDQYSLFHASSSPRSCNRRVPLKSIQ